jgi:hypothetical protein
VVTCWGKEDIGENIKSNIREISLTMCIGLNWLRIVSSCDCSVEPTDFVTKDFVCFDILNSS